jgi:hypothetical protein
VIDVATSFAYGNYPLNALSKLVDWMADTVTAALLSDSYTPDQDNHIWLSDVVAFEMSGGGYARQTLTAKTRSYAPSTNTTALSCADLAFPALTLTNIRYLVFFHDTGVSTTSALVSYVDFGGPQAPTAQTLNYAIPSSGVIAFPVA